VFRPVFDDEDDAPASAAPRVRGTLRLRGDGLDPEFITQQLGVAPTVSARRGEPPEGRGAGGPDDDDEPAPTGLWAYELSAPEGTELGDAVDMLLARVPNDAALWEELAEAYEADVHCVVDLGAADAGPHALRVDAEVLQRLARLRLALTLDVVAGGGPPRLRP
jgi:hypothetical protein